MKKTYAETAKKSTSKRTLTTNIKEDTPFKSLGNLKKDTVHTTIYIGNLSYKRSRESIKTMFQKYGGVSYVNILMDKKTSKSKGFGFIQMKSKAAATKAIAELNESELDGRTIKVSIAVESQISKPSPQKLPAHAAKLVTKEVAPIVASNTQRRKRDKGLKVLLNFLGK